jgi:hypothetical protein
VLGGVGAQRVKSGFRGGGNESPLAPYRARGCVKFGFRSLVTNKDSYNPDIETVMTRIIRSAISGYTSIIHGNLLSIATACRNAPMASRAVRRPAVWQGTSLASFEGFFNVSDASLGLDDAGPDSSGAAMASWLILASDIFCWTLTRYVL